MQFFDQVLFLRKVAFSRFREFAWQAFWQVMLFISCESLSHMQ
jgi:hypothetical protein